MSFDASKFGYAIPIAGGLLYLALLLSGMASQENGLRVALQLKNECAHLREQIGVVQEENVQLSKEWDRLREDPRYIEKIAREELHMVGDREIIFFFPSPSQ